MMAAKSKTTKGTPKKSKQNALDAAPKRKPAAKKTTTAKQKVKAAPPATGKAPTKRARKQAVAPESAPVAKKRKPRKKTDSSIPISAERKKVLQKSTRKKNVTNTAASAIAQARALKALESISVMQHDQASETKRKASKKKGYTKRELHTFQEMLLRVREQLEMQVKALRSESLRREDSVNSEEDGTDAYERQMALNLAGMEGDSIFAINEALQRIEEGTYGSCQECGCLIRPQRLKALPFVQLCITCKSVSEKGRNGRGVSPRAR